MSKPASDAVRKKAFVESPIGAPGTDVYQKAAYALIKRLYEADLVVADLTGHNPNVFYELAIAHGWRKSVVHLISKGEKVPFDIVDQRTIFYDLTDLGSLEEAVTTLGEYAEYALDHADELVNPLTSFAMFNQIRADDADGGDAVADAIEQVVERLAKIENRIDNGADRGGYLLESDIEEVATQIARHSETISRMTRRGGPADAARVQRMRRDMDALPLRFPPNLREQVKSRARQRRQGH